MAANDASDTPEAVQARLVELRIEHRDLDEAINRLTLAPPGIVLRCLIALRNSESRSFCMKSAPIELSSSRIRCSFVSSSLSRAESTPGRELKADEGAHTASANDESESP